MTDKEQIRKVFQDFEDGGLVSKDIHKVLSCVSDRIIGIGIGEQGVVRSKEDVRKIFENGLREDDKGVYSLEYNELEILIHDGGFANALGDISINRTEDGAVTRSRLQQTLVFIKEDGAWKICGLHASAPMITEENMEAYPLNVAEKLLLNLREEIGEKAYLAEEQFQKAVLSDTIAFYIVNITKNRFEKCQVNRELCAYAEPGAPYEEFVREHINDYVKEEYRPVFLRKFSLGNVWNAISNHETEITCEYMMQYANGTKLWALTVMRLITDCVTGDQKGILYVKDIDRQKRVELEMKNKAERDDMTGFYNKTSFVKNVELALTEHPEASGAFFMLDVDNFKVINDTFGHPFGDRVLVAITEILQELFQESGILGRLGGDEFGIFVPSRSASELSEDTIKAFMQRLGSIKITEGSILQLSCSIGISEALGDASFDILYQQADRALYRSKQEGKGRYTIYGQM